MDVHLQISQNSTKIILEWKAFVRPAKGGMGWSSDSCTKRSCDLSSYEAISDPNSHLTADWFGSAQISPVRSQIVHVLDLESASPFENLRKCNFVLISPESSLIFEICHNNSFNRIRIEYSFKLWQIWQLPRVAKINAQPQGRNLTNEVSKHGDQILLI